MNRKRGKEEEKCSEGPIGLWGKGGRGDGDGGGGKGDGGMGDGNIILKIYILY